MFQLALLGSDDGDGMRVMTDGRVREDERRYGDIGLIFCQSAVQISIGGINSKTSIESIIGQSGALSLLVGIVGIVPSLARAL